MMKPIGIGKKNYLFCGSGLGAKYESILYSIIETCKMKAIRPVKYIAQVLKKLVEGKTDYSSLLPINNTKKLTRKEHYTQQRTIEKGKNRIVSAYESDLFK